jgi:protein-L-isoaspartate(D-aspartate) O-methyltransferase
LVRPPFEYRDTPDDDPRHLYHNVLVALVPELGLNNGQPAFLALLIDAAEIAAGDRVVHIGCGVGYYSAIMAELAGPNGHVTAIEVDPRLAERAKANLADRNNITAVHANGIDYDFGEADVVLVNAGVTHPQARWLERLSANGRILVPITTSMTLGVVFRFARADTDFSASVVSPTMIFPSTGGRDPDLDGRLTGAYSRSPGALPPVASLRVVPHEMDDSCWLHSELMCLSKRSLLERPGGDR